MREKITGYVRHFQPHIVVTHWPEPNWHTPPTCNGDCAGNLSWDDLGYHPDHKHVGQMAFNSLYSSGSSASNSKLFKEVRLYSRESFGYTVEEKPTMCFPIG